MPPIETSANPQPSPQNVYPTPSKGPMNSFDPNAKLPKLPKNRHSLLIPLIIVIVLFLAALGFGIWAFMGRQEFKNNSDAISAAAVAQAEAALSEKKEAEFAEREKEPLKSYKGSATYGSLEIKYPKTWSAFITETDKGGSVIDGYLHPDYVPGLNSGTAYALHFEVTSNSYDQEVKKYETDAENGRVTVQPTSAVNVAGVAGVRVIGEIENDKQGTVILFPVRDRTLKLTSESTAFAGDFENIILKNIVFVP